MLLLVSSFISTFWTSTILWTNLSLRGLDLLLQFLDWLLLIQEWVLCGRKPLHFSFPLHKVLFLLLYFYNLFYLFDLSKSEGTLTRAFRSSRCLVSVSILQLQLSIYNSLLLLKKFIYFFLSYSYPLLIVFIRVEFIKKCLFSPFPDLFCFHPFDVILLLMLQYHIKVWYSVHNK